MAMFKQTALTSLDSYKIGHGKMWPEGTTKAYSNFTPRSAHYFSAPDEYKDGLVVWVGLQMLLAEMKEIWRTTFFDLPWEEVNAELDMYLPFVGDGGFDREQFKTLWEMGYLPLEIKALPEGSLVPINVPVLTITNTRPEAFWLPNYLETWLSSELWKCMTSATSARVYRRIVEKYAKLTGGNKAFIPFQVHDFSVRGMSGIHDAAKSGVGHLLAFKGTDNIPAVKMICDVYDGKNTFIGGSVGATEHSVTTAGGKDSELDTLRRIIGLFPTGIVSLVADSYDFWQVMTDFAPLLKDQIMARQPDSLGFAKVVFRPDSGDPIRILAGYRAVEVPNLNESTIMTAYAQPDFDGVISYAGKYYTITCHPSEWHDSYEYQPVPQHIVDGAVITLARTFGTTTNELGFKTLDQHVGLIYGDSITPARAEEILQRLMAKGYASDNVVFGVGSYTYQMVSRDTLGSAMKCTYVEVDGVGREVFKDPKTDSDSGTKRSARGLLRVDGTSGNYVLKCSATPEEENGGALSRAFLNDAIYRPVTFEQVRAMFEKEFV